MPQVGISESPFTGGIGTTKCFEQKITLSDTATDVGPKSLSLHWQSEKLLQLQIALDEANSVVSGSLE